MKGNANIERINVAAFGKLSEKSIELAPGINLITAPNEGGKSTLAAFIRFALYGFKGRSQSIAENPKKMYMPWSGAAASGSITLSGDRRLRIERSVIGNKETLRCTDPVTGETATEGEPGEEIFGVGCDIFEKTLFLSTAEPPKSKDSELADRLQNLVFSADEQIGGEKAEKLLTKHKNALKGRANSGKIYALEAESAVLEQRLIKERAAAEELGELEAEALKTAAGLAAMEEEEARAEECLKNVEKYEALLLMQEHKRLAEEKARTAAMIMETPGLEEIETLQGLQSAHGKAADILADKEEEYNELCAAPEKNPKEQKEKLLALKAKRSKLKKAAIILGVLTAFMAIATVAAKFISELEWISTYLLIATATLAGAFTATAFGAKSALSKGGFKNEARLKAAEDAVYAEEEAYKLYSARLADAAEGFEEAKAAESAARQKLGAALEAHGATAENSEAAISALLKQHIEGETLKAEAKTAANALEIFEGKHDLAATASLAEGATRPEKPKNVYELEKKAASQRIAMYRDKLNGINQRIAALNATCGDPLSTAEALSFAKAELKAANARYDALSLALEELSAAGDEMKASISPRLASVAGDYFCRLTEGAHISLELDTKLSLSCDSPYGQKSGEHLSAGARDGVYICLRLALIDLLFEGKKVPFILDDAFARIDNRRLKQMIKLLYQSGHQLIISSAGGREEAILKELDLEYKHITL